MKRLLLGMGLVLLVISFFAEAAEADRNRRKRGRRAKRPPMSSQISPVLGELKWGMSEKEVLRLLIRDIRNRYRHLISQTKDAVEDDRLRTMERNEIDRTRKSLVRFNGRSTGWDIGFLRDEFTHDNHESMLSVKGKNSQNFYFFIDGKLWKWYKALNIKVFEGKSFGLFSEAMQRKFGPARTMNGKLTTGSGSRNWLEWEDKRTRLRAIDQTAFYGFYCLVFEEKSTLENLSALRSKKPRSESKKKHALIEAVTSTSSMSTTPDDSPDIVDRITGKIRHSQVTSSAGPQKKSQKLVGSSSTSSSVDQDDDPLGGLDFL